MSRSFPARSKLPGWNTDCATISTNVHRRHGRLAADKGRHRESSEGANRGTGCRQQSRRSKHGDAISSPSSRALYIDQRTDFREAPAKGFFRLSPGHEVRLRYVYIVKCWGVIKDSQTGEIKRDSLYLLPRKQRAACSQSKRKVKATIHWLSTAYPVSAGVFACTTSFLPRKVPMMGPEGHNWMGNLNPQSLERLTGCRVEPFLVNTKMGFLYQFELRIGHFCVVNVDSPGHLVFNRAVTLRDTWVKDREKRKKMRRIR